MQDEEQKETPVEPTEEKDTSDTGATPDTDTPAEGTPAE